jgi:hypothetical protein
MWGTLANLIWFECKSEGISEQSANLIISWIHCNFTLVIISVGFRKYYRFFGFKFWYSLAKYVVFFAMYFSFKDEFVVSQIEKVLINIFG